MDSITSSALVEICTSGPSGIPVRAIWSKLRPSFATAGLDLCPGVKAALWTSILAVPSLRFVAPDDRSYSGDDPVVQRLEEAESLGLSIVAADHIRDSFLGLYDLSAADAGITRPQRRALELLAAAGTNGITQRQLTKKFDKKANNMFYIVRNLECQGLVTRHSTVVRTKDVHNEGESSYSSTVSTNMIYLYCYSKKLGSQQRLEIRKEGNCLNNPGNVDESAVGGDSAAGKCVEEVLVKDNLPAMKAICDKLEEANGKVFLVSDIKKDLGYLHRSGHRHWRNICKKLKDAGIVEEFHAKVNEKKCKCLRLLNIFSPTSFEQRSVGFGDDYRHEITDQFVELPIEHRVYDMIDAEGPAGLTVPEVCRRLGIKNKKNYYWLLNIFERFKMHLEPENCNKGRVYRVWTSENFNTESYNAFPSLSKTLLNVDGVSMAHVGDPRFNEQLDQPIPLLNTSISKGNIVTSEEANYGEAEAEFFLGHPADGEYTNMLPPPSNSLEVIDEQRDPFPEAELNLVRFATESNCALLESSPSALLKPPKPRSYQLYPCLTLTAVNAQREQRILELLQEEKFILRAELHRWLESLEQDRCTVMDRKTLIRILSKLQKLGHCRCIDISVPVASNYQRSRIAQVVLHPSIQGLPPELLGQIHDRMKTFDLQTRHEGLPKSKNKLSVPVLNDVQRIPNHVHSDYQALKTEAMRANGFVIAKMVRVKLLHSFLWDYLNSSSDTDGALLSGNHGCDLKNPHSTCKLFVLDGAIKAIPLELFLQVVGSSQQFDDLIEKCKRGLHLSDLPVQEYKRLMDTRATGRLSWLIDMLRRLKLIRVVTNGQSEDGSSLAHTALTHAMELKPYIEEPLSIVSTSSSFIPLDLRPRRRHDFILSNRKAVDVYWKTLEYCYAAADPATALHAFPGTAVHEVFRKRSWASVRVMTAEQRTELLRRIVNDDLDKKICFQECERIAKDLSLTLEQVLRFYYEKRQQHLRRFQKGLNAKREEFQPQENNPPLFSRKRKRSLERQSFKLVDVDAEAVRLIEPSVAKISEMSCISEEENLHRTFSGELDSNLQSHHEDGHTEDMKVPGSLEKDEEHYSFISQCAFSRMKPPRQEKFTWTEEADRQLIIQYVRYRAAHGAKFNRVEWSSLLDLPAPQSSCRRRMHLLKRNDKFRKFINRLCNMLGYRYAKHLDKARKNQDGSRPFTQGMAEKLLNWNFSTKDSDFMEEPWDDFDDESIMIALDEVLRHRRMAKLEASKRIGSVSENWSDLNAEECDLYRNQSVLSGTPSEDIHKHGRRWNRSSQKLNHRRLSPKFSDFSNRSITVDRHAYESLAVSNAVELFKLIFLENSAVPEVAYIYAETLRRYSEHDLSAAGNFLKKKKIMVGGDGSNPFVLSQQFLVQNVYDSPFPTNTGERAARFASWLHEREKGIVEEGISLDADLQCGDIFHLFALVYFGELSVTPCLPDEGFGEAEDSKNIKRKADSNGFYNDDAAKRLKPSIAIEGEINSRKAKGFPGITVFLSRKMISMVNAIQISREGKICAGSLLVDENDTFNPIYGQKIEDSASHVDHMNEIQNHESTIIHVTRVPSESLWEAMTGYAKYFISIHSDEEQASPFYPKLFRTVYAAIQRAGDQGLCMEEVSQVLGIQEEEISEIIVEVLEAFGRAMRVNAYDSVRVVDALYQPKYFLTSMLTHSQEHNSDPSMKSPRTSADGHFIHHIENNLQKELNTNFDDVHKVTILNHPEEVVHPFSDIQHSEEEESCMQGKVAKTCDLSSTDFKRCSPILPWINGNGTINSVFYEGLTRCVLGTVMQNPGILEDNLIQRMDVLNPQSCKKLLELMTLDNHLIVRKMHQTTSDSPPSILSSLLGSRKKKSKSVFRRHLFANPLSTSLL